MSDLPDITPLSSLPTIIDKPGIYILRDGRKALIHEISGPATFNAKGAIFKPFRGKMRPRGYRGWHPGGRANAIAPHKLDIVAWDEAQLPPDMPE